MTITDSTDWPYNFSSSLQNKHVILVNCILTIEPNNLKPTIKKLLSGFKHNYN